MRSKFFSNKGQFLESTVSYYPAGRIVYGEGTYYFYSCYLAESFFYFFIIIDNNLNNDYNNLTSMNILKVSIVVGVIAVLILIFTVIYHCIERFFQ